jgi:hypothetical protein
VQELTAQITPGEVMAKNLRKPIGPVPKTKNTIEIQKVSFFNSKKFLDYTISRILINGSQKQTFDCSFLRMKNTFLTKTIIYPASDVVS